ncbi:unnamed protein product, partial [Discosporangium mesarthrocarpum]
MRDGATIYMRPGEDIRNPPRAQGKRFIVKIIFLGTVARLRKLFNGVWFDAKIGIWPVIEKVKTKRSGKNSTGGAMEIK